MPTERLTFEKMQAICAELDPGKVYPCGECGDRPALRGHPFCKLHHCDLCEAATGGVCMRHADPDDGDRGYW